VIDRVMVPEAAKLLNISEGAVRQRIHRGTLRTDKDDDGRVYVYVTPEDTQNNGVNTSGHNGGDTGLLDELRDRIRFLEEELADRKEENRRKDTILMTLSQRIPELEAPIEPTPKAPESSVRDSNLESRGVIPQEGETRSWWRRIFQ
jgi:hypothetical protein